MLNNLSLHSYITGNSFFHKLNPFIKILSMIFFLILTILCNHLISHFFIFLFLFFLLNLSKIPFIYYKKSISNLSLFFLFLFIFNLFFTSISYNIVCLLRLIEIILYSKLILFTTKISELNYGFTTLCYPLKWFKINPLFLSMSITLTIYFIPIVANKINDSIKSLKSRGIHFSKNIKQNIILIEKLFLPIFTSSIERANHIAETMEMKGFSFENKRSNYIDYKMKQKDILFLMSFIIFFFVILRGELL